VLTIDNLGTALKAYGVLMDKNKIPARHANLTLQDVLNVPEEEFKEIKTEEEAFEESNKDQVLKQVYATLKDRNRRPPPGGYPFPKNDHAVTKLDRKPLGPCCFCGSKSTGIVNALITPSTCKELGRM
jgi:hypothetical protein